MIKFKEGDIIQSLDKKYIGRICKNKTPYCVYWIQENEYGDQTQSYIENKFKKISNI